MRAFLSNSPRCVIVFKYATRSMLFQVALQSPSGQAGLLPKDLLVAVQGQTVLDRSHEEVVKMIKRAGETLGLRRKVEEEEDVEKPRFTDRAINTLAAATFGKHAEF